MLQLAVDFSMQKAKHLLKMVFVHVYFWINFTDTRSLQAMSKILNAELPWLLKLCLPEPAVQCSWGSKLLWLGKINPITRLKGDRKLSLHSTPNEKKQTKQKTPPLPQQNKQTKKQHQYQPTKTPYFAVCGSYGLKVTNLIVNSWKANASLSLTVTKGKVTHGS